MGMPENGIPIILTASFPQETLKPLTGENE
jgi:hypothetical protein